MQTIMPLSFWSQLIMLAVQSGAGRGGGGAQQSVTIWPEPHGTSCMRPVGTLNIDASRLNDFIVSAKSVSVTSELISQPHPATVLRAIREAMLTLRMIP